MMLLDISEVISSEFLADHTLDASENTEECTPKDQQSPTVDDVSFRFVCQSFRMYYSIIVR